MPNTTVQFELCSSVNHSSIIENLIQGLWAYKWKSILKIKSFEKKDKGELRLKAKFIQWWLKLFPEDSQSLSVTSTYGWDYCSSRKRLVLTETVSRFQSTFHLCWTRIDQFHKRSSEGLLRYAVHIIQPDFRYMDHETLPERSVNQLVNQMIRFLKSRTESMSHKL